MEEIIHVADHEVWDKGFAIDNAHIYHAHMNMH